MLPGPILLALTSGEVTVLVIALVVVLVGVFGQVNEAKKANERKAAARRGDAPSGGAPVTDVDSLAQRRREQLEAMARRRRAGQGGGGGGSSGSEGGRPENMTTTQAVEREAARTAYAERAAALREEGAVNTMLARGEAGGAAQAGADAERAALEARREARQTQDETQAAGHRARRKQEKRRSRPTPVPPPLAPQRQSSDSEPSRPSRHQEQLGMDVSDRRMAIAELGKGATEVDLALHGDAYESEEVHRHVADVSEAATAVPTRASRIIDLMAGRSWRDVMLLKEVLDPPLAMRSREGPSDPYSV